MLFDGETSLKSPASQARVLKIFGIKVKAEPGFKRQSAERYIREIKVRTRVALDLAGKTSRVSPVFWLVFIFSKYKRIKVGHIIGKTLRDWRSVLDNVVNVINYDKPTFKNNVELLTAYFNQTPVVIPQKSSLFRYALGQQVRVNVSKMTRQNLNFKYSLEPGG